MMHGCRSSRGHCDHQAFAVFGRRYERKLIRVLTRLVASQSRLRDLPRILFWRCTPV